MIPMGKGEAFLVDRILVVDDDVTLCGLLAEYLEPEGFGVDAVHDGDQGVEAVRAGSYDLVVLDVMLPRGNGFDVLHRIRSVTTIPVLMLTARGEDVDRIVGLEMGADDYLAKPFNPRELVARIRAVLRRARKDQAVGGAAAQSASRRISVGDVTLDTDTREARCLGRRVELTSVEFGLLALLLRNAGQLVAREEMNREVLGRALSPYDRSIDVHVSKLRKKLGHEVGGVERIKSVRGAGYVYVLTANGGER
jgi:DNA-binding response OmpR family regulator